MKIYHPSLSPLAAVMCVVGFSLLSGGCAHQIEPKSPEEKPYFGKRSSGSGGFGHAYVPREVRRVEPWWSLF